jgi:hypothetical protein
MRNVNVSTHRVSRRAARCRALLAVALLAGSAGLAACARDAVGPDGAAPEGPSFTLNPACDPGLGGMVHQDSVLVPETWTRANNPHRVDTFVSIEGAGVLTLQPGVLVCFTDNGALLAQNGGRLVANGLDTARIVLTAEDPAQGWWGVHMAGSPASASSLRNVRLEHTDLVTALSTHDSHAAIIDSTVFRQNQSGLSLWGAGTSIRRSRVDTVTTAYQPAVSLGTSTTFEKTVIRGAAGVGLAVVGTSGMSLLGGRIEGSGGVGMQVTTPGYAFVAAQPLRIVGGASYPAEMVVSAFPKVYLGPSQQDSLLGNARDTVVITGGTLQWYANASSKIPWRVTDTIFVQWVGILHATPGASLAMDSAVQIVAQDGGTVVARGTAAAPVLFTGAGGASWGGIMLYKNSEPVVTSYLTNVRVEYVREWLAAGAFALHTVVIDSAVFRQNGWGPWLLSWNSRISRSRVDTTLVNSPAVALAWTGTLLESTLIRGSAGPGLSVDSGDAIVRQCEIRESAGDGILNWNVATITDCNLVQNAGVGINNLHALFTANVENNWWGDAAGPTGTNGDGVSGFADYTPWRTAPVVLPYVP